MCTLQGAMAGGRGIFPLRDGNHLPGVQLRSKGGAKEAPQG
jgi:hypothetical protein